MRTIKPVSHAYFFDPAAAPAGTVRDGETVRFCADHAASGRLTFRSTARESSRLRLPGHALTGPVAVAGARPGDVLRVDILSARSADWGWGAINKGQGQLPERGTRYYYRPCRIDPQKKKAYFRPGLTIPTAPFFGVMGVTPRRKTITYLPGPHGGNMDCRELAPPATLYLPVFVPGALFLAGDGHAAQGHGEVSIAGLECAVEATLRFSLVKNRRLAGPFIEKPGAWIFPAFGKTLDQAAAEATRAALRFLEREKKLPPPEAYVLCSFALDLIVTQVVDPLVGIHAVLPKKIFR